MGSKAVEGTSIRRKPSPFAGRWWKRIFGQPESDVAETPTTTKRRVGDPGAREMFEEGSSPHGESFTRALSARATEHGAQASQR